MSNMRVFGNVRTDLALEARDLAERQAGSQIPGVRSQEIDVNGITVTRVEVLTREAERILGKAMGKYITIETQAFRERRKDEQESVSQVLAQELLNIAHFSPNETILVAGLGNWNATPDKLGPATVEHLLVTRHLHRFVPPEKQGNLRAVCAISPGVLGITGMETAEIIAGIVDKVRPAKVIVVDALAARSVSKLATTIQIGNTGINPGSGIGNRRWALTERSIGVPVIAIGIPTVVDAITIVNDAFDVMEEQVRDGKPQEKDMKRNQVIAEVLSPYMGTLFMTPKEIDDLIDDIAICVAGGLNAALHPGIDLDDILNYIH
jgi:spore protease